jgi:hypothetical protein
MGTMITGLPKASAETKSEASIMASTQKSKERKSGNVESLGGAESKKEVEGNIEIDDDVALTFPQRVSNAKRMVPRGPIFFELPWCSSIPQYPSSMFLSDGDSSTRHCIIP